MPETKAPIIICKKISTKKEARRKAAEAKALKLRQENLKKKRKEQAARVKAANKMRITITERIMQKLKKHILHLRNK